MRRFLLCALLFPFTSYAQTLTITLVGTGGPELTPTRSGISTAITSGISTVLVDAGRDTLANLYRSRIDPNTVTTIFLTHLHSDHIDGLPDLWLTPWFLLHRAAPLTVYGPPGTRTMIDGMRSMYAHDIEHRANPAAPRRLLDITVHELSSEDVVTLDDLRITAYAVEHADGDPAFAFRISNGAHTAFLTGDCTLTPPLVAAAGHPDVLIANVAFGTPAQESLPKWKPVFAKLLTPSQAAELFQAAQPRLAVFSHIVTKGPVTDADLLRRIHQSSYTGKLLVGHDHTLIAVAKSISVSPITPPVTSLDGSEPAQTPRSASKQSK